MSYHQMYFVLTGSKQSNFFFPKKNTSTKKKAQIKDVSVDIDSLTALAPLNRCLKHDSPKQKPCPATGWLD